jgi:hypothetical protein
VNIINYSWIYIYKKIFKFSKPSILEDRIWDTDISSSTSMDITFNTLNTTCFTLKIIVSWSFGNKIVIFMDDRSKSSNKSCDKFCIFASCSPPPWEEAQWHMLIKLWVAFVAIHLCPCALSLLFFLSLVNLLLRSCVQKNLYKHSFVAVLVQEEKSMAASCWILLFSTPSFVYFLLYHGKCNSLSK